jgi:hypothetical protein
MSLWPSPARSAIGGQPDQSFAQQKFSAMRARVPRKPGERR